MHCAGRMTASPRLAKLRLFVSFALFCFASEQTRETLRPISQVAQALLYHQLSPIQASPAPHLSSRPLLDRISRQPPSIANTNSSSYYSYLNNSPQQQQQQQQAQPNYNIRQHPHQRQQQTSYLTNAGDLEDLNEDPNICPDECHCNKVAQIADCSNRNLTRVPTGFPRDIKRIRLERNNISEIGPYAFQGLRRLQRIDLSNNNLQRLDPLAFFGGLQSLNSLILYSNKLEQLPDNLFSELSQLQLLLLNANSLLGIGKELFHPLANLNLLSLYDNNLATLQNGTFEGLKSIKTIHLGKNPLSCDCNLRWLADYFELNPVETSEARCEAPQRLQGKKLGFVHKNDFKCSADYAPGRGQAAANAANQQQQQQADPSCPAGCVCNGSTVDCSRASQSETKSGGGIYELPDIPDDLPVYVARVHINDSRIKRIRQTGLFRRLANSQKLDLGNNKIVDIEDNAIDGQFNGQNKPERVVFVLIENQHCEPAAQQQQQQQPRTGSSSSVQPQPHLQQQPAVGTRQQAEPGACEAAPKVNEPQFDSPCYNGGSCRPGASGANSLTGFGANYSCLCPPGFMGSLCEINIDDCADHQCQNGALCVDGVNSYKCICRDPTTTGEFCEQLNPSGSSVLFSYATNSANSLNAPLALPIIAPASVANGIHHQPATAAPVAEVHAQAAASQPVMIRSASELYPQRVAAAAENELTTPSAQIFQQQQQLSVPPAPTGEAACKRVTQRQYVDDGNGCKSARLLKVSLCLGHCDSGASLLPFDGHYQQQQGLASNAISRKSPGATCCAPARVKRRRIRMQCSDGASYVKTVDLVKRCACSSECVASSQSILDSAPPSAKSSGQSPIQRYQQLFGAAGPRTNSLPTAGNQHHHQHHHFQAQQQQQEQQHLAGSASQEEPMLQITRLDAVD